MSNDVVLLARYVGMGINVQFQIIMAWRNK